MADIEESLQKITLKEISQTPFAYALYIVTIVLMGVIAGQRLDARADKTYYENEMAKKDLAIKDERKEKDEVFKAYLVERGANQQIQHTVDSTAIKKFNK